MVRTSGTKRSYAIELQTRSILRDWLEYPTENVNITYLAIIGKTKTDFPAGGFNPTGNYVVTLDSFSDKAVRSPVMDDCFLVARMQDLDNYYEAKINEDWTTSDYRLRKIEAGSSTVLGSEAVDLDVNTRHLLMLSISGSTINAYRNDMTTPVITATDTTFASGMWGIGTQQGNNSTTALNTVLLPPASEGPKAKAILEIDVIGSGTDDDEIRPNLLIDYPVTWGAYEYKDKDSTMMVVIFDAPIIDNITKQLDNANSKGFLAMDVPDTWSYYDAVTKYKEIKKEQWIAGKDNFAYHVLRVRPVELFQNADFYYGNIVDLGNTEPFKKIPDFEMWRRLDKLEKDLLNVTILTEERDKHLNKVREVKRLGW